MLSLNSIKTGAKIVGKILVKYAPQILTGVGIACMAASTAHAIKEAPKAKEELEEINNDPTLTHKEYIKKKAGTIAKHYWPVALMTIGGAGLIIGGQHVSLRRLSVATAALSMERDKLKKLEDKLTEKLGDKKLNDIKDEIAQDDCRKEAQKQGISSLSGWYNTGHGTSKFYDPVGKRFFLDDFEYIRNAVNKLNSGRADKAHLMHHAISMNKFYEAIGLPPLDGFRDHKSGVYCPNIGKDWGWIDRDIVIKFTSMRLGDDDFCNVLGFTEEGSPRFLADIDDYDTEDLIEDDETDMKDRGKNGVPWYAK